MAGTATAVIALTWLLAVAVQFEQALLRWRAERLMADMHRIRLYQSTWADAQKLIHRWGAWGHYDGTCTAEDCRYNISIKDALSEMRETMPAPFWWLIPHHAYLIYRVSGGRFAWVQAGFRVHNGTTWRTYSGAVVDARIGWSNWEEEGLALMAIARSAHALRGTKHTGWVAGSDDDLAEHPYHKAGRPGGCTSCEMAKVTYSTHTPPAEIKNLTTYDFSCFTRFWGCANVDELLPAAKPWFLYGHNQELYEQDLKKPSPRACDIPLWAQARDAGTVLVVDVLSVSQTQESYGPREVANVRVVEILKGDPPWPIGTELSATPYGGQCSSPPFESAEHFRPGHRYVIFPDERFYGQLEFWGDPRKIVMSRCGVRDDTAATRAELTEGFAQNDNLGD